MNQPASPPFSPARSIRSFYEQYGADAYYEMQGSAYRNPHEPIIVQLLADTLLKESLDMSHVLDLAAGTGEVTLALRGLGADKITGIDPFTADAYAMRTGTEAERFTFADVAAGALAGRRYSLIVCSFALHLCDASRLPTLVYQLARVSNSLLIITPHKRPVIRFEWGWKLVSERLEHRVRSRLYRAVL